MADEIRCPMCGKSNPAELDVCQYCEARLKPLTDELSSSQPPIRPGEEPTEMDTGQLEEVLPQWLREVRQQARESAEEDAEKAQAAGIEAGQFDNPDQPSDLLAGLQSQSDDDEEVPDWLAGLRGETGQPEETSAEEDDDLAALRNMLGGDAPAQEPEASALPGWISDLGADEIGQTDEATEEPVQAESQLPASDSDFDWVSDFGAESGPQTDSSQDDKSFETDLPAWLQGADETPKDEADTGFPMETGSQETPAGEGDLPNWLSSLGDETAETAPQETDDQGAMDWMASLADETSTIPSHDEQPEAQNATDWLETLDSEAGSAPQDAGQPEAESTTDWLKTLGSETEETPQEEVSQPAAEGELPDWLSSVGEESSEETSQQGAEEPTTTGDAPDWLSSLGEESPGEIAQQASEEPAATGDMPDWLSSLGEENSDEKTTVEDSPDWLSSLGEEETVTQEAASSASESDLPDWLSSLGKEETGKEEEVALSAEFEDQWEPLIEESEASPDWLSSLGEETGELEQAEAPELNPDEAIAESDITPAFVDDEGKPISSYEVESIFSMDMPDWLSEGQGMAEGDSAVSVDAQGDDLRPAELPSWVQAMRPVESVISETDGQPAEEQPVEEQGPLAGLRGVLPAVPGIGPSSKPKAYSLKLQASEDQQANVVMLEQMLAEEIHPKPVSTQKVVLSQSLLRWVIALLLLVVVGGTVFSETQINAMPTSAPLETSAALEYVRNTLPSNAPVLMVFDYEAAQAGELEASAAPLIDLMLTLKAPRLSLLSSTPTGSGLAERFMGILQADREFERDKDFLNLGYLPGGAAGVMAFSENPILIKPLTTTGENAWATTVLQDVKSFSEFKAIIVLTSDAESARIWIEQTEHTRGDARLLIVSSAQSGPMISPYVQSGQVDGIVTGLDNSAPIEWGNGGRPGMVRRYWDAYGFGLLTAASLIVLGSLWSLVSGWQTRRKDQGEE